jgi:hypothetical protein
VICRIREEALVFDPRTVSIDEEAIIIEALAWALREEEES